jgi:hypothetical protein
VVGYVPRGLPQSRWRERLAPGYDELRATSGGHFSPLEPLVAWQDVLAAEITLGSVGVLGVGGGELSRFEYRLGSTLGARVGLAGSGRAADQVLREGRAGVVRLDPSAGSIASFLVALRGS